MNKFIEDVLAVTCNCACGDSLLFQHTVFSESEKNISVDILQNCFGTRQGILNEIKRRFSSLFGNKILFEIILDADSVKAMLDFLQRNEVTDEKVENKSHIQIYKWGKDEIVMCFVSDMSKTEIARGLEYRAYSYYFSKDDKKNFEEKLQRVLDYLEEASLYEKE